MLALPLLQHVALLLGFIAAGENIEPPGQHIKLPVPRQRGGLGPGRRLVG